MQALITDVLYVDAYPYDTATFSASPTTNTRKTVAGFHVGADVTVKLSTHVSLGGLLRFCASATITAGTDNAVTTDLRGLQAAGGARIGF